MRDRDILRNLANRWMELANLPVMAVRKRQWTAVKDLHAERPMLIFETRFLENYIAEADLACKDPLFRQVEKTLRWNIRHAEEVGDDIVLDPEYRIPWVIDWPDYGVPTNQDFVTSFANSDMSGIHFDHPIKKPQDIVRLKTRSWKVDRKETCERVDRLNEAFGDILPIALCGAPEHFHGGITNDLFLLIGNDNLLRWVYDAPDAIQHIMAFLRDDRLAYLNWLEKEGVLGLNNGWASIGGGSPGFIDDLPAKDFTGRVRLKDMWFSMESQETTMISPSMFERFFLPFLADLCQPMGLIYYGCCEPLQDRWDAIIRAIPNIRAVSVSAWADQCALAEKLGKLYVFSRKPKTWLISITNPDWNAIHQDLIETLSAARDCNLEIIYRDIYRVHDDRAYPRKWTDMVRAEIN